MPCNMANPSTTEILCSNCHCHPIADRVICGFEDWCSVCDTSLHAAGEEQKMERALEAQRFLDSFKIPALAVEAANIRNSLADNVIHRSHQAAMFQKVMCNTQTDILLAVERLECRMVDQTPHELHALLLDVAKLQHRLASSPPAKFLYNCHARADDIMFQAKLHLLNAGHAAVCQADDVADAKEDV